jgi:CRP/FNR family transcriptional regulator, cyclic AMP receptor protein
MTNDLIAEAEAQTSRVESPGSVGRKPRRANKFAFLMQKPLWNSFCASGRAARRLKDVTISISNGTTVSCRDNRLEQKNSMKLPNIFEKEVTPLSFSGGSVIFAEGQKRESMYVVKSGEVELKVSDKTVEVVGVDGFFGEMALVDQATRSATAIAKTDCTVVPINEKHFLFMVEETPFFALTVMRTLTARLRRMDELAR